MATWYLAHIHYQRESESGALESKNEHYLLDAVSYTEAEARLFEVLPSNKQDFQLKKLAKMPLSDVFIEDNGSETWYKAKVQYISFDEKTAKEKRTPHNMLINAEDVRDAFDLLKKNLGNLNDYEITDINLTNILEVSPYQAKTV